MPLTHTYLGYDPIKFGSPNESAPDLVSGAMDHLLAYGRPRRFTPEELANAIRLDPSQIQGLGPSLESLIALLEARKRAILETYETSGARNDIARRVLDRAAAIRPPTALQKPFAKAIADENIPALEKLWDRADEQSEFARELLRLIADVGKRYEIEQLASRWTFVGRTPLTPEQAVEVKEELETIERLLKQLREALKNAKPAIIDLEALSRFAGEADVEQVRDLQRRVNDLLRRMAEEQGLEDSPEGLRLTPKAMRLYQSRLLERIFGDLQASRSGRHDGRVVGDGAVELPSTRAYEFGDSPAHIDFPQSLVNAAVREARDGGGTREPGPVELRSQDIEVHRTRNLPKCATVVIMDMSGSMRYGGQYVACKRMALALDGLIRREYPGDRLEFIEMYSLARRVAPSEIATLMPKPVSVFDPIVRLRADMSDPSITEMDLPLHFTNIQRALRMARQILAASDTPNRQIVLLTDGLPTAHFEDDQLLLLYPPDPRTEQATLREALACKRDRITLNVMLLPNWNQSEEDVRFAHAMAESTGGRVLFTAGQELDRFVVWDYVSRRRSVIG
ncbi:MAG: VWA domain-containing protein [Phycisphaerales bacterium]